MMVKGYLQAAKGLLNQLSSEVRVNTYHLPYTDISSRYQENSPVNRSG